MDKVLVTAGIVVVPTLLLAFGLKAAGRKVGWAPLLTALVAMAVYFSLLRSGSAVPVPAFLESLELPWVGKTLSLVGTCVMLRFLPGVDFKTAGFTWKQNTGSLQPVSVVGGLLLLFALASAVFFVPSPNVTAENLLFQAILPGPDEEFFFRGLLLLLLHQAFGKTMRIWSADTGWGLWLVVAIFGLAHGFTFEGGVVGLDGFCLGTHRTVSDRIQMRAC